MGDNLRLEQYLGLWAMHESTFKTVAARLESYDIAAHVERNERASVIDPLPPAKATDPTLEVFDDPFNETYEVLPGGIALIHHGGTMTKYGSSLGRFPGTVKMREQVRRAARDNSVRAILYRIDNSPGGNVSGVSELADELYQARQSKPLYVFVEDLAASAAYYVASQGTKVIAQKSAGIGSIGVFGVIQDTSELFEKRGIKVHVVKAGQFKGTGVPGTEVTDSQLGEIQRSVNEKYRLFVEAVARGRGMSTAAVEALADGRVHIADKAVELGLIDAVGSSDEVLAELRARFDRNSGIAAKAAEAKGLAMDSETKDGARASHTTEAAPATLKELKEKFPKSTAELREKWVEAGYTVAQAGDAWREVLEAQNEALAEKAAEAEKKAKAAEDGVDPVTSSGSASAGGSTDAIEEFKEAVSDYAKMHNLKREEAHLRVCRENPQLRERYVAAYNAKFGRVA